MTMTTTTVNGSRPSWREELRRDRESREQLKLEQEDRRSANDIARQEAAARIKRDDKAASRQARDKAAAKRAARRKKAAEWVADNPTGLLFVLVIGIPILMTSAAQAEFGGHLEPLFGWLLPGFSEGSMWAFEAKAAAVRRQARRDGTDRPTGRYQVGAWVCGGFGFALNFLRGISPATTGHGLGLGLMMGLLSIAGLAVYQMIQARPGRPRKSRQDRARLAAARDVVRLAIPGRKPAAWRARRGVLRTLRAGLLSPADTMAFSGLLAETGANGLHAAALSAALGGDMPALDLGAADALRADMAALSEDMHVSLKTDTDALRADIDVLSADMRALRENISALFPADLSARVRELREGNPRMSQKAIAAELGIDPRTVRRHLAATTDPAPATA